MTLRALLRSSLLLLLLIGTGCSPTKVDPPAADAVQARFTTLASAVGALQHCRSEKIYTGKPDLVTDTFLRLAGVMQSASAKADDPLHPIVHSSFGVYVTSFTKGTFTVFSPGNAKQWTEATMTVSQADQCTHVEALLIDARKPKGPLDVKPIDLHEPGGLSRTSDGGDPTFRK